MRLAATVILLAASASGCRERGAAPGTTDASDGSTALPLPPEVQAAPTVCTLKTDIFRPFADVPIRAGGTTPPYATVLGAKAGIRTVGRRELRADLGIPADPEMPFSLRLYGGTFDLRGIVDRNVPIYAGMPLALGSFAAALPHTELKVIKASAIEVEVEAQLGPSVEILAGAPRTRGPCGLFAFERRDFAASAVIPGVKWKSQPDALLKRGKKIPLTTLPIGEPVARIEILPGDSAAAVVFEKDHGRAHIGWYGSSLMIHGWIAASDLEPLPKDSKPALDRPPPPAPPEEAPAGAARLEPLVCPNAVPIVSINGDSRVTVGTLRPGGSFELIGRDHGWAEVRGKIPLVEFTAGTRLVVRESDLSLCSAPKPPPPKPAAPAAPPSGRASD